LQRPIWFYSGYIKYYNFMQHKALRLFIFIYLVVLAGFRAEAQNLTKSPYSILGIGEMQFLGTALQSSMGQVGQGMRRPANINVLNPASYSGLKYAVIDGGATYGLGQLSKGGASSSVDNLSFSYFNIAFPLSVKHGVGMAFGLSPYSNIGYNVSTTKTYTDYESTTHMTGTGGFSRFYMGAGAEVLKWDSIKSKLSVGFNASYIFGQINKDQQLIYPEVYNKYNIAETRRRIANGIQLQGGLQFHHDFTIDTLWKRPKTDNQYSFVAGLSYTMGSNITSSEEYFIRSLGVGQTSGFRDTIAYIEGNKGTIKLPFSVSAGISFEKKDRFEKKNTWMVGLDINYTDWSSYSSFGRTDSLKNSLGLGFGASFVPNPTDYKHYYNRIEYRLGARYDNGNIKLSGKDIETYGVSAGLGLPLGKSKSRLNISAEYFVRGTAENNLIKEEYFRFVFGINFSDTWFQRYKYE
jgi:long-subunit fatty acid transport protein